VTDLDAIAVLTRSAGARLCVDAVAYAPHRAMAAADSGADYYAFSLYKVFGPHCAALFGRPESLLELENLNHRFFADDYVPGKLEPGAFPYELVAGAAAIPKYLAELAARSGAGNPFDAIALHEREMTARFLDYLDARPDARVMGNPRADDARLPTISFVLAGRPSRSVPPLTDAAGIGIRFGHFYAPALMEALGLDPDDGVIRVSLAHYNTLDEVDRLIAVLDAQAAPVS
jgi:selenocysteine lyase/cysteine desulfurase